MNNVGGVHVLQAHNDFGRVEAGAGLVKAVELADPGQELAVLAVLQHKVELVRFAEGVVESDNKGRLDGAEDLSTGAEKL